MSSKVTDKDRVKILLEDGEIVQAEPLIVKAYGLTYKIVFPFSKHPTITLVKEVTNEHIT